MKKSIFILLLTIPVLAFGQIPVNDSFSPTPGEYIISAWLKDDVSAQEAEYDGLVRITTVSSSGGTVILDVSQSQEATIIDGWVRVIDRFTIPADVQSLEIELVSAPEGTFFDDVRVLPFNGSMKSFVYDPLTQRLMAELDENNYATFYEYDQEGGLVRVKKTARGVYTIQETWTSSSKTSNPE